jgi:hypothetical protein
MMEIPNGRMDQMLKALLYPSAYLDALELQVATSQSLPAPMWRLIATISAIGTFVFGWSAGLIIAPWSAFSTGLVLLAAMLCGWLVSGPLLALGGEGPPYWQRAHAISISMITGELIFECGMVLNGLFWLFDWLTDSQAVAFNLLWITLADVVTITMIASLWKSRGVSVVKPITIWIGVFHPVAFGVAILLGRLMHLDWFV